MRVSYGTMRLVHEAHYVMTAPHRRARRRTADGAGGASDEHRFT
jgi:hypothetical protein